MKEYRRFEAAGDLRFDRGLLLLALACLAMLLPVAFNPAVFNDGDTSWHLAAGKLILERGAVPQTDPFSYTFAGAEWVAHEWLAEVVMVGLFDIGEWSALALMTALSVAAVLFIIAMEARLRLKPLWAVAVVLAVFIALAPFIVARPHVLAWPILAGWTLILLRARGRHGAPNPAAALLMLVWANLHGSFLLGLLLTGVFSLEALLYESDRARTVRHWGLFGFASLAASLATPHGPEALIFPLEVASMKSLPLIGEWRSTDLRSYPAFAALLFAAAVVAFVRRSSLSPPRLLLLAALAYLSIEHVRHQAVLAIVGSLILVGSFPKAETPPRKPSIATWTAILLAVLLVGAVRLAIPAERPDSASNPVSAIAALPSELGERPVLNSYAFGGPLILAGIRPYIDGRADMYGDEFMFDHRRMMRGDLQAFRRAAERWNIGWTILSPLDPLSRRLDEEPGWRRIYADRWAVVHVAE